jgi:protein phosphatase
MTTVAIPELSLVVLVGVSGSGKSTFAARHFLPTEVLSSDAFRAMVGDDANDQTVTREAFEALHAIAGTRLTLGRLTVIDATNVQPDARKPLVRLARDHHVLPVAIVLDLSEELAQWRNAQRPDRAFGAHVVRHQAGLLRRSIKHLQREGFRRVFVLRGPDEIDAVEIVRERGWSDRSDLHGPFDLIGDVHGCSTELGELLDTLGYTSGDDGVLRHPDGRMVVFLGDLVDRGPDTPAVLRTAMSMTAAGSALCVPGNHEQKLLRALRGRNVQISHGLAESLAQLEAQPEGFRDEVETFLDGLISHAVLDDGKLVVAHAGLPEQMHGRASAAVRAFALYGETTGEIDEFGLPVRYPWATGYRGSAMVVYGHTPVPEPEWINNTICVDTGCVFGGALTALRYPERELVSVRAKATYYEPAKPFLDGPAAHPEDSRPDEQLDIEDVLGARGVQTRLLGRLAIPEGNAAAALEVMSRFAVDPRWLLYLPPTMAPSATSKRDGLLEHPDEAFDGYRRDGVAEVICEEKHMGSRAVILVCRDDGVAERRFRIGGDGRVLTRTGRAFFGADGMEPAFLARLREAIGLAGLWDELGADWILLDAEIVPWSLKADDLLRTQYAAVGAAATAATEAWILAARRAQDRGIDTAAILGRAEASRVNVAGFIEAYRRYSWAVDTLDDVRVAPFQLLAAGSSVLLERDHTWHMGVADRLAGLAPGLVRPTRNVVVNVTDPEQITAAVTWWESLTDAGGEGMVVKPVTPIVPSARGLVQPGIKVRGREYLRLIYGPDYTEPAYLGRLRQRGLGRKRSLAAREFALGVEALERVARGEPLHRVHACVFAVLALESEPVDPRL